MTKEFIQEQSELKDAIVATAGSAFSDDWLTDHLGKAFEAGKVSTLDLVVYLMPQVMDLETRVSDLEKA
jgi:hypothetical protein